MFLEMHTIFTQTVEALLKLIYTNTHSQTTKIFVENTIFFQHVTKIMYLQYVPLSQLIAGNVWIENVLWLLLDASPWNIYYSWVHKWDSCALYITHSHCQSIKLVFLYSTTLISHSACKSCTNSIHRARVLGHICPIS